MSQRTLADLSAAELQRALDRAQEDADMARYADSNTPRRLAMERVDAISAEIRRRQLRQAT